MNKTFQRAPKIAFQSFHYVCDYELAFLWALREGKT